MRKKLRSKQTEKGLAAQKSKAPDRGKILRANKIANKKEFEIQMPEADQLRDIDAHPAAYDENLLECSNTQWQFGDWVSLAALDRNALKHHPDRAKLALLAAAGNIQINNAGKARQFIRSAQDWGCGKNLVSQILIAGVHNTLGRAAALMGQESRAYKHFERAVAIGTPGNEVRLISQARAGEQYRQIGLPEGALELLASRYGGSTHRARTIANTSNSDVRLTGSNIDYSPITSQFLRGVRSSLLRGDESDQHSVLRKIAILIQRVSKDGIPLEMAMTRLDAFGQEFHFVHVAGDYIPRKISDEHTFYESTFLELLQRFHRPGGVIIDGGANIGNHTLYFAKVVGAEVIAFEPEPHNASCLAINLALNGISDRVQLHKHGLGQTSGMITLQMNVQSNFGSFTTKLNSNQNSDQIADTMQVNVPVRSLDAVFGTKSGKIISILKLDVEGMELDVLRGAKELIRSSLPVIAVECFTLEELGRVESFLEPMGYFPVECVNATPTILFVSRNNYFHLARLADYLRASAVERAMKKNGFV
jgi:FkbM family methyltransferase